MPYLFPTSHRWQQAVRMLAVAVGVFALSWLVAEFTSLTGGVAVLWPTNGLILGICLLVNDRLAKQTLLAAFVGNLCSSLVYQTHLGLGVGLALANVLEMAFAWLALRSIVRQHPNLGHPEVLWRFSVFAVLLAPVLSGALASLLITSFHPLQQDYWKVFRAWWASDSLGMALFAPLAVTFRPAEWSAYLTRDKLAPMLMPWVVLVGATLAVFSQNHYPLLFFIFPPLIWLVFRWGFPGATIGGMTVLLISFPLSNAEMGPLMLLPYPDPAHRFFLLQVFMGTTLLSALPVGMVLDHRNRLMERLRRREAELEHLAMHDSLSGLLNRRGLMETLDREIEKSRVYTTPLSVVVLDIDHFKAYNDTYGHPAGDECLAWLGGELSATSTPVGGISGRQGGEEFAVVLPGLNLEEGVAWAELLRKRIENARYAHAGSPTEHLTVSIGVASLDPSRENSEEGVGRLLKHADRALYMAKEGGRNRVVSSAPSSHG